MTDYSGITVILNRPSRFDLDSGKLISGNAGDFFDKQFAKYGINRKQLHIQTAFSWENKQRFLLDNTKCILLLGHESLRVLNRENTLGEIRGSPFIYNDIPVVSSFSPQDSFDMRNYEDSFHSSEGDEDDINDRTFNKGHGVTARRNYRFWLRRDIIKSIRIAQQGMQIPEMTNLIFPDIDDICRTLRGFKNCYLHIDIETDPNTLDITVFSFAFESYDGQILTPVYTVPLRRYNYLCAYDTPYRIWQALVISFANNTVVTHNGHQYDLFVFTYRYRIPFPRNNFDTIIGQHRNFPEVEKSLGHCISLYTDFPFHKNDGIWCPQNRAQEMQLWVYNAKDVHTMIYVRQGIEKYAKKIGSWQGIIEANEYIQWTLIETFTGIRRDNDEAEQIITRNNFRIKQLNRILNTLVGYIYNKKEYDQVENNVYLNVRSNKQMQQYLFNSKLEGGLGLTPYAYGAVNKKTGKAAPSADEKSILRLQVKHGIASLAVILELRRLYKQTSSLEINYWNPMGASSMNPNVNKQPIELEEKEAA